MSKKATFTRRLVLEILENTQDSNEKLGVFLRNVLDKFDYLDNRDKAFIKYLVEGVVSYRIKLDYVISNYAKTKGKMKPVIRDILRMGIYQIIYMDQVPDSAACNEAVNLAIDRGYTGLKGFVNGVLRTVSREKNDIKWPDDLSVIYSSPKWLCDYLVELYGRDIAKKILAISLEPSNLTVRIRENLTSEITNELLSRIVESGCVIEKHKYLEYAYCISEMEQVTKIPGFKEGHLTVQDVSSQLLVELAGIKPGDYVVDVCAAPGGKALHAADKTGNDGTVDARDLTMLKLSFIEDNIERLHITNVKTKCFDATSLDEDIIEKADVVICDVPCSGIGVIGRKNDIKYNISRESIESLALLQQRIVSNAVKYLKKGGILMYSTCTVSKEENVDNFNFIKDNLSLKPVPFEDNLPKDLQGRTGKDGYLQLLPGVDMCDGFFISKFVKEV